MGDAQSAQREGEEDAADGEESGEVDDAQTQRNIEDKPLKNKGQISEINGKADSSKAEVNGHCENEIAAKGLAVLSPDEDVSQTETPLKEETVLENAEMNEKESPDEADVNDDIPLEITEMNAKQNDINESFRRFFSNIGLKLTVKRGSGEIPKDVPNDTNKEEPNNPDTVEDTTKETTSEKTEQNTDVNVAKETCDNDSTTCPTLTDVTSEKVLDKVEEREVETKVEVESDNGHEAKTSPPGEDVNQHTATEEKPRSTSLSIPEEEEAVVVSPVKRFFTTGLFSGLRKKKKPAEDETTDKEVIDTVKTEKKDGTVQDQQEDKEDIGLGVDAAAVETADEERELKGEVLLTAQPLDASTDSSSIFVIAPELLSSQEKDKVQNSPMKRLLLGSNLKKLSTKQRSRRSSDEKLSNSGEHESDQLLSSPEKAENQKEEDRVQPSTETTGEEEGAWASFKKLVTPKKRIRKCSLSSEGTQISDAAEEQKPSEGGQMSDHSTEEGKKRKDSSVSWESVLCGSGRRRTRKTSDSEDETPQIENDLNKPDGGSKLDVKNEVDEMFAHSSKQAGGPSEGNGASTWQSLKRLVTPKRKAKGEDESNDNVQSDSDVTQDESSLSRKKLLPGRKKRKPAKKQDQVSSDETDKEAASGEEDSDTPAVVPLSEFDTDETEVCIQPHLDVESLLPKEAESEIQQDLLDPKAEPVLPCDKESETKKVQGNNDTSENQATTTRAADEEPDDLTESISKQQLSDIPEEATPASVTEEAARDDTIADDLIEITSEAITAAEHLDTTLADETEMISAVSQLSSESSKTSGNTTPVPAQYVVEETNVLLYQVVETISGSPEAVPVCSYELRSEATAFSVSHQILETFLKEKPTILELHRSLEPTQIDTDQKLVELDAQIESAHTTQIESTFEVSESVSTEVVSEVLTEEFDTAEITEDEVKEVDVALAEYSVTDLEDVEENTNKLAEVDKTVPHKGSLVEALQQTEPPKLVFQEADVAAKVADKTIDGAIEQEVQSEDLQQPVEVEYLSELANIQTLKLKNQCVPSLEKDITSEAILAGETVKNELKDELETYAVQPEHVHVPEEPEAEKASTSDPKEGSLQSPTEDIKPEDTLPAETVTDEPNLEEGQLTGVSVDPGNQELQVNPMKTVPSLQREVISDNVPEGETDQPHKETLLLTETNPEPQEQEVLKAVLATEIASKKGSVQSFEKEQIAVPGETGTCEPKHSAQDLPDVSGEPENHELLVISKKTVQELEVFQAGRAPKPDSQEESVGSLEEEFPPVNIPEGETDEPTEEATRLHEANRDPVDVSKTEHIKESEVFEADQQKRLDSEEVSVSSEREETKSEDIPLDETVTDEPKQSAEVLPEVSVEPEKEELPPNVQVTETPEVIQAPVLDSEGGLQTLEKEVISEIVPDKKAEEPKEGTIYLSEDIVVPVDAYQTEHVKEPQASEALPAPTLNSEEGSRPSPDEDIKSEDVPTAETVSDEPKESAEILPEVSVEPEYKELVKVTESIEATAVLDAVQAPTLDSEEGIAQSLLLNLPQEEPVPNEPNETEEHLTQVCVEPVDAFKTQQAQEAEVQAAAADPEECSVQALEKQLMGDDVTEGETVTEEPKQEAFPLTEANLERADAFTPGQETQELQAEPAATLDSEKAVLLPPKEEVISEDIPVVETITDGPEQENEVEPEKIPVEAPETERAQEPEALPSDVMDRLPETNMVAGTSTSMQVVTESVEGGTALLDDVPEPPIGSVVASVTDKGVVPPEPSLEKTEAQEWVQQEDHVPIVVDELPTSPTACASAGNEEAGNVQVLEKTALTEDTPAPGADNAAVTNGPKHGEHGSAARAAVEGPTESERSGTEVKFAPIKRALVAKVVVCNMKDVSVAIPDILIEQTSPVTEPLREIVTRELMSEAHVESSAPLVPDQEAEAAEESSVVVTMHVPTVESEDNHRILVQVVGDDVKSAESCVDAVLEVGITQVKEVIDACHGDVEEVIDHYATPQIEEELIHEPEKVTIEGVILHAKENLPEKEAETTVVHLGQEGVEQPDAVTEESEAGESESAHSLERREQTSTVIRGDAATRQPGAEELTLSADIPARPDVPIHPQRDESEETKADEHKEAQTIQTLIITPADTEVLSSIGNVDTSSNLSIELKLNINFGQANKPASLPTTTKRSETANKADMSEVGVQAVDVEPVETTQQIELAEVAVQGTADTEAAENMDSKERCVIASQPVLLNISIQAMEAEAEMKSPETVTCSVQVTETKQPGRQTETTEDFPTHTEPSEACEQQTEAKKPAHQKEEDQDVWMDAEEDVCTQEKTEASRLQVEEPPREDEAGLEHVLETAERGGTDSECEDFAFAPEHPEIETVRVIIME